MDNMVTLEACFEAVGLSSLLAEDARFASTFSFTQEPHVFWARGTPLELG
ncbi:MAG: hypothetical protein CM1200mP22_06000 [Dehalococcoidia bacterium]|nr:MAG: hypothetical protein CM1200mP22_06000 [Dehalococcoidia bacterium]